MDGLRQHRENPPAGGTPDVDRALVRALHRISATLDVDTACQRLLDVLEELAHATTGWCLLHDPEAGVLRARLARGREADAYAGASIPEQDGVVGVAFSTCQVVFVPDVQSETRWFDPVRLRGSKLGSVCLLPLVVDGRAVGVAGFASPDFGADRPPTPVDLERLGAIAAQAAVTIVNARTYEAGEDERQRLQRLVHGRRQGRRPGSQETSGSASYGEVIGASAGWRSVVRQAELVAPGDTTVLLLGETGTGKELLARLIHERGQRADRPFVAVNCAALPPTLVESELFGHEKGAFTGAITTTIGKFEAAHGGTLFLDEIGDLPSEAQAKLLRVLQDSELQRVGGTQTITVDVRVIAATNQELAVAIAERRFREDLYYRLCTFPIAIPALRDRIQDIPPLTEHFATLYGNKLAGRPLKVSRAAVNRLAAYQWPGNVRELANVIERAVILAQGNTLTPDLIRLMALAPGEQSIATVPAPGGGERLGSFEQAERDAILAALAEASWRISGPGGAAAILKLKPTTLHAKMRRLGIKRPPKSGSSQ